MRARNGSKVVDPGSSGWPGGKHRSTNKSSQFSRDSASGSSRASRSRAQLRKSQQLYNNTWSVDRHTDSAVGTKYVRPYTSRIQAASFSHRAVTGCGRRDQFDLGERASGMFSSPDPVTLTLSDLLFSLPSCPLRPILNFYFHFFCRFFLSFLSYYLFTTPTRKRSHTAILSLSSLHRSPLRPACLWPSLPTATYLRLSLFPQLFRTYQSPLQYFLLTDPPLASAPLSLRAPSSISDHCFFFVELHRFRWLGIRSNIFAGSH